MVTTHFEYTRIELTFESNVKANEGFHQQGQTCLTLKVGWTSQDEGL